MFKPILLLNRNRDTKLRSPIFVLIDIEASFVISEC